MGYTVLMFRYATTHSLTPVIMPHHVHAHFSIVKCYFKFILILFQLA